MAYDTQGPVAGGPASIACDLPDARPLFQALITDGLIRNVEVTSLDDARRAVADILGPGRIVEDDQAEQGLYLVELDAQERDELEREGYLSRNNAEFEIEIEVP